MWSTHPKIRLDTAIITPDLIIGQSQKMRCAWMTAPGGGGPGGGAGAGDRDNNSIICTLNNATAWQSIYVHMIVY